MLERFIALTDEGHQNVYTQIFQPNTKKKCKKTDKIYGEKTQTPEINAS